jgi:hypothetical protein
MSLGAPGPSLLGTWEITKLRRAPQVRLSGPGKPQTSTRRFFQSQPIPQSRVPQVRVFGPGKPQPSTRASLQQRLPGNLQIISRIGVRLTEIARDQAMRRWTSAQRPSPGIASNSAPGSAAHSFTVSQRKKCRFSRQNRRKSSPISKSFSKQRELWPVRL